MKQFLAFCTHDLFLVVQPPFTAHACSFLLFISVAETSFFPLNMMYLHLYWDYSASDTFSGVVTVSRTVLVLGGGSSMMTTSPEDGSSATAERRGMAGI